ncbi:MAG: SGNH/GDSL hydrolase family protein [Planctomycetaceae bacterium]
MKLVNPIALLAVVVFAITAISPADAQNQEKAKAKARKRQPSPALAQVEDVAGLPRVLLIGDSISMGYTLPVREALQGKANVHRPAVNCGPTTTGLKSIDQWLGDKKWDVIHFNWGLHDMKFVSSGDDRQAAQHRQVSPEEYEKNLQQLVARLKQTGAKLIWRNTTPVPQGAAAREVEDAARYNEIAAKVMNQHNIPIHDLYSFVQPRMNELMLKENVHFTPQGYDALAKEVAAVILKALDA